MNKQDLYTAVRDHGRKTIPMHMPGHKRNTALLGNDLPYDGDITEIDGFDNLHDLEENGILMWLSERAAVLYGAKKAFPLVNGTTCGILSAIRALTKPHEEILIARNCHKSVYHAVELCALRHVSLLPPTDEKTGIYGGIRPCDVEAALCAHPNIRTAVITSPTYEGVVSDIDAIAEIAHRHGVRLIVDGAHGAHFGFSEGFPAFPRTADIVVTSLHKTLPSLTQTALLLVFSEDDTVAQRLARELSVFETSSPSYILLASIDRCIALLEQKSAALFADYEKRLAAFYDRCATFRSVSLLTGDRQAHPGFFGFDRGKLVIRSNSDALSGKDLADRLRRDFSIEPEMAYTDYVLCMTSVCDSDENFERLFKALQEIDRSIHENRTLHAKKREAVLTELPRVHRPIAEAALLPEAPLRAGEISHVYAWVYPPGIPLLVPGEEVTAEALSLIQRLEASGLHVKIGK